MSSFACVLLKHDMSVGAEHVSQHATAVWACCVAKHLDSGAKIPSLSVLPNNEALVKLSNMGCHKQLCHMLT